MFDLPSKLTRIYGNSLARNTGWMIAGQGSNFFLQAGYFLVLTRLLGVTEFGIFAGAFALVNSVTPYSSLGSSMIFMRYVSADRDLAQVYWGNILAITSASSLPLMVLLALVGGKLFGHDRIGLIAVLVVANCFMSQIVNSAGSVFQTFEQLRTTAWLQTLSNCLRLVVMVILILYLHHATAFQCALGILISSTLAAVTAMTIVRSSIGGIRISAKLFRLRFWEGLGFSFAGSTQALYNDVDKMMLSHYGMNVANGIYTMAYRIVDFSNTPVSAIDAALLPRFFTLHREGFAAVGRMARKVLPIAVAAGLAAAVCTLLASPLLVRIVGHGFGDALLAIRWLCWLPALRAVHQLTGGVLTATGRQSYRTGAQFMVALFNLSLNLILIPKHGWLGAAWASLASDGALGAINLILVFLFLGAWKSQKQIDYPKAV